MGRLLLATLSFTVFFWPYALTQQTYSPPEVTSAGDAYTSYNIVFDGLFVLDIGVGDDGGIRRIESLRNPGSMFGAAKTSVRNWKFQPAFEDRKPTASRLTVAFVYRPANYPTFGAVPPKDFTPVIPSGRSDDGSEDYAPVGILSFAYPDYPINSVVLGIRLAPSNRGQLGGRQECQCVTRNAQLQSLCPGSSKKLALPCCHSAWEACHVKDRHSIYLPASSLLKLDPGKSRYRTSRLLVINRTTGDKRFQTALPDARAEPPASVHSSPRTRIR